MPEYRRVQTLTFSGLVNAVNVTKYAAIDVGPRGIISLFAQRKTGAGTATFQGFKTFLNGLKSGVTVTANDYISLGAAVAGGSGALTAILTDQAIETPFLAITAVPTNGSDYTLWLVSR